MGCIYRLNFTNDKFYIGQTSKEITECVKQHQLTKGAGCPKLFEAWKTETFLGYEVLEECSVDQLDGLEQKYISELRPPLNTLPGGKAIKGLNHPRSKYTQQQIEQVVDLFLNSSLSYTEIADATNVHYSTVQDIIHQRNHEWAWEKIDPKTREHALSLKDPHYVFYDIDNNRVESRSNLHRLEIDLGLPTGTLRRVLQGNKSKLGWSLEPHPLVEITSPLGETKRLTVPRAKEWVTQTDALSKFQLNQLFNEFNDSAGWQIRVINNDNRSGTKN